MLKISLLSLFFFKFSLKFTIRRKNILSLLVIANQLKQEIPQSKDMRDLFL
tara:strand:- start:1957 stop:2109 length:153 start_codon:yes stop_codon:yes gene_type:complete